MADKLPLSPEVIDELIRKIVKFAETINEKTFYPYQLPIAKRITRSLLTNEGATITALLGRQGGKTEVVAAIVAANMELLPFLAQKYEGLEMYEKGFWAGIFAPVGEQAVTMFDRIYDAITTEMGKEILTGELRMPIPAKGGGRGNIIKLMNGSLARMHSANRRAKINSKTYHIILLDECLSGDTEVLTPQGWIRIDNWDGEEVALLNDKFETLYEVPKRYIQHDEVPLITAKCKRGLDYTTTPGHNIVYTPTKNPRSIKKMDAISFWGRKSNQGCRAIKSGKLKDPHKLSYLERVGVMLNADGCKYNVKKNGDIVWKLEFSKKRKIERCKYLLTKAGIEYRILSTREFTNPNWNDSTKIVFTLGATDYKQSFRNWLTYTCGIDFLKEILFWDGYVRPKIREYDSRDKDNVEFVEQVCVHSNVSCSPIRTILRKNKKHSTMYRLEMFRWQGFAFGRNDTNLKESYGSAYCFETSTGMFFIRKNGIVLVTGNCQDVESFVISTSVSPMGSATNATMILTGTPAPVIGFFYDQINLNKAKDARTNLEIYHTHFEFDANIIKKYNKMYAKYIAKEETRIGKDSDEYLMSYMLVWPITKGMMFTKALLEEKCYRRDLGIVTTYKKTPCVAGLDIGKSLDSTILTILKQNYEKVDEEGNMEKTILDWLVIEGDDWEDQYPQIVDKLNDYWVETLIVDATGAGDPVRERIAFMVPEIIVAPFVFSPSTKDTGYKYLIKEINAGRLLIPHDSATRKTKKFRMFEHEMCSLMKNYSGKFLNPGPVDKSKGHDDRPDSLMLAVYATFFDCMPTVEEDDFGVFSNNRMNYSIFGSRYSRPRRI